MQETKAKKRPQRMCNGCGQMKDKAELIRVVATPEGAIVIDRRGKVSGRGAYLCPDAECLQKAVKTRRLERNLKTAVPAEIFDRLREEIGKNS